MTQAAIPGLEQALSPLQAEEHIRVEVGRCPMCGKGGAGDEPCTGALPAELDRAREFIRLYADHATSRGGRRRGWSFATSMPDSPHEYAVRERCQWIEQRPNWPVDWPLEREFEWFVVTIRARGYQGKHGRTTYTYMNVRHDDGVVWRYWTMGNPLDETTIINRTPVQPADQALLRAANVKSKAKP